MRFLRPVVLLPATSDPAAVDRVAALVRVLAPEAEVASLCAWDPTVDAPAITTPAWDSLAAALDRGEGVLARLASALAPALTVAHAEAVLEFAPELVAAAVQALRADLLVVTAGPGGPPRYLATWLARSARELGVTVAWLADGARVPLSHTASHLLCPFDRTLEPLGPIARFLAEHDHPDARVTFLGLSAARRGSVPVASDLAEVAGLQAHVAIDFAPTVPLSSTLSLLRGAADDLDADLICFPFAAASGLVQAAAALVAPQLLAAAPRPVLFIPGEPAPGRFGAPIRLDTADTVVTFDGALRVHVAALGPLDLDLSLPGQTVALIAAGAVLARAETSAGPTTLALPVAAAAAHDALGLARGDTPHAVEQVIRVVRPDQRRVLLVHADLPAPLTARLAALEAPDRRRLLVVRLRPATTCREHLARLAAAGLYDIPVLDASTVLDAGDVRDAPPNADAARLLRVARHLRASGFAIDAVVGPGARALEPPAIAWLLGADLDASADDALLATIARLGRPPATVGAIPGPDAILDELTSSRPTTANSVLVEVDNAAGRRHLFDVVSAAERWIHLQAYIVKDDPLTRDIEQALRLATARGVTVRVLVDSLYSLHGSFGAENALLARLASLPGVEVRAAGRIDSVPDLEALKQRDHRKLLAVDGTTAIITGRNLAASYYRSFDEADLGRATSHEDIPWLDAGAVIRGPAAGQLDDAFASAWRAAGGLGWHRPPASPEGSTSVRVVIHRGLRDTRTLDAYVALIRQAREHLTVVNGFPLAGSLSRALLAAKERGVRVRILSGHFRPLRGDGTPFPGVAPLHELADQVAHGRIDRLIEAGIDAFSLRVWPSATDSTESAPIQPHVHAKLLSVDGRICTVGSANLDVTAGYWEDEVLAIIDDPDVTATLDQSLDRIIAGSHHLDPADPSWRAHASRRAWISRYWPSLLQ
jgi:cardiolipin synthase